MIAREDCEEEHGDEGWCQCLCARPGNICHEILCKGNADRGASRGNNWLMHVTLRRFVNRSGGAI